MSILGGLVALFWPGPCVVCGRDLPAHARAGVCASCWLRLPARVGPGCPRCDLPGSAAQARCPDCRRVRHEMPRRTVAAFVYDEPLVALHRRLKFGGAMDLVPHFARVMARAWRSRGDGAVELVVPVPPDPLRWSARRGVPRRLARAVADDLGLECARRALVKRRPTRSLTGRSAAERRRLLAGAFRARREAVLDRRVLLIDDVATTGATLRAASIALRAAGARSVAALVLARTPRRA